MFLFALSFKEASKRYDQKVAYINRILEKQTEKLMKLDMKNGSTINIKESDEPNEVVGNGQYFFHNENGTFSHEALDSLGAINEDPR